MDFGQTAFAVVREARRAVSILAPRSNQSEASSILDDAESIYRWVSTRLADEMNGTCSSRRSSGTKSIKCSHTGVPFRDAIVNAGQRILEGRFRFPRRPHGTAVATFLNEA